MTLGDLHSDELFNELMKLRDEGKVNEFANLIWKKMMENPDDVLDDGADIDVKIKAISSIIEYFTSTEEFEKCADLKKFLDQLNARK